MTKRLAKEYGIRETELENYDDESQSQDEGSATLDRGSTPRGSRPSDLDRGFTEERWEEEEEGKG